jgi:hypothetical protein
MRAGNVRVTAQLQNPLHPPHVLEGCVEDKIRLDEIGAQ